MAAQPAKTILHIRDSSGIFGAERVILTLGKNLNHRRFHFLLLCLERGNGQSRPLVAACRDLGIEAVTLTVKGKWDRTAIAELQKIIQHRTISLLHCHDFKSNFYGWQASRGADVKKILTAHGSTRDSLMKKAYLWLDEHLTYRKFDHIIAVSADLQNQLIAKGIPKEKIQVIQNGLDWDLLTQMGADAKNAQPLSLPEGKKIFAVVGRLFADKGHRYFLQALKRVKSVDPNVAGLIVGDGPEKEAIRRDIEALGLSNDVILAGIRHDMNAVYGKITALVISSLTEGLPYVLLEAMASRVPVIATAVGDIPLLVTDGQTGSLIPAANQEIMAQRMLALLNDPKSAAWMAERAADLVRQHFSASAMVRATEDLYLSVCNQPTS